MAGEYPASAVPRALGLRRLGNGWVASDPAVHFRSCSNVDELADILASVTVDSPAAEHEELGIGGTVDIAKRLGVTRRRAQQLVAAQRLRIEACGDLFGMV